MYLKGNVKTMVPVMSLSTGMDRMKVAVMTQPVEAGNRNLKYYSFLVKIRQKIVKK